MKGGFSYLLNMNIMTFTFEKLEKLQIEMKEIKKQLEKLKNSTPEVLWIEDLDIFEAAYKGQYNLDGKEQAFTPSAIVMPKSDHRTVSTSSVPHPLSEATRPRTVTTNQ